MPNIVIGGASNTRVAVRMVQAADGATPITGLGPSDITFQISVNGGAFANPFDQTSTEIGFGWYAFDLVTSGEPPYDVNNAGPVIIRATAASAAEWMDDRYTAMTYTLSTGDLDRLAVAVLTKIAQDVGTSPLTQSGDHLTGDNLLNFLLSGLGQGKTVLPTSSGAGTSYQADGVTVARTYTITTDANAAPFTQVQPG